MRHTYTKMLFLFTWSLNLTECPVIYLAALVVAHKNSQGQWHFKDRSWKFRERSVSGYLRCWESRSLGKCGLAGQSCMPSEVCGFESEKWNQPAPLIFLWQNSITWAQGRRPEASEEKKAHKGDSADSKLGKKGMRTGGGSWMKGKNGEVT